MCIHGFGQEYVEDLEMRRKESIAALILCKARNPSRCLCHLSMSISSEWPDSCDGWLIPELFAFITRSNLFIVVVDGCSLGITGVDGLPALKRYPFITSSERMRDALAEFKCEHPPDFKHADLCGADARRSAIYPKRLCRAMLSIAIRLV